MNIENLNEVLKNRKIVSIEEGSTPGWLLINFDVSEFQMYDHKDQHVPTDPGTRVFLTVYVGGRQKEDGESHHHWTCALKTMQASGGGMSNAVRDGRNPDMPMSSAWHGPWVRTTPEAEAEEVLTNPNIDVLTPEQL